MRESGLYADVKKDSLIFSFFESYEICFADIKIIFITLETMRILRFIRRLTGRKPAYAPVLAQQATYLVQASRALLAMTESEAMNWMLEKARAPYDTQITRERDYFMSHYGKLYPSVYLSYEREAYYHVDDDDFRVTFDDNIFARRDRLSLCENADGLPVLPAGRVLMEIKCSGAIPLWMADILSSNRIYKTSFSKYGRAYTEYILPELSKTKNTNKETLVNVNV